MTEQRRSLYLGLQCFFAILNTLPWLFCAFFAYHILTSKSSYLDLNIEVPAAIGVLAYGVIGIGFLCTWIHHHEANKTTRLANIAGTIFWLLPTALCLLISLALLVHHTGQKSFLAPAVTLAASLWFAIPFASAFLLTIRDWSRDSDSIPCRAPQAFSLSPASSTGSLSARSFQS